MNENKIVWGTLIIIVLAIGLTIYFWPTEDTSYNDFEFVQGPDGFYYVELNTMMGDQVIPFYHHPKELRHLEYDQNITTELFLAQRRGSDLKLAIDTEFINDSYIVVAGIEISKITSRVFGMPTTSGFTEPIQNISRVFTCDDASNTSFVVKFMKSEEMKAVSNGTCAIIHAPTGRDAVMMSNLFVFKTLGVMI
ncbi:MAG: hypothetical protein ACMXX9_02525 [Candidatus Woesearchaeota archaeon]